MGTLLEEQYTFSVYLAQLFLEWEMFHTNSNVESKGILCSFFSENAAVYEIMQKDMIQSYRPQMTM
jgi:hypothetical protein